MKNTLFIFILLCSYLASCSTSETQFYEDKSCNFKIKFPGNPTISNQTIKFPFGSFNGKKIYFQSTDDMNQYYSVYCVDLPQNIIHSDSIRLLPQLFALTQMDYLQQYGENCLLNTYFKDVNKYPGREYVWGEPKKDAGFTRRVFLVKNKLYLLEVAYTTNKQHNLKIGTFLDSFKLLSSVLNKNPEPKPVLTKKKFNASFPGPTITKNQIVDGEKSPEYVTIEMYQVNNSDHIDEYGNSGYAVNFMNFQNVDIIHKSEEEKKKFIYENSLNNPLVLNGGKVISLKESTIDGTWCYELKATTLGGNVEFIAKSFFKDQTLYQVLVLSSINKSENEATKKFMESFHHE